LLYRYYPQCPILHIINFAIWKEESTPKSQFNGKPDTERSRSVFIIRCLHPSTPLRIQLIGLFGADSKNIYCSQLKLPAIDGKKNSKFGFK